MTEPATEGASERPGRGTLLAVYLVSASVLAMEIALTRIFSAALNYHFTFLVVSLAVCGLGLGGMLHALVLHGRTEGLGWMATALGLSGTSVTVLFFRVILVRAIDDLWVLSLLVIGPFLFAGLFLSAVFRRWAGSSGRVYGSDLLGSACAVPAVTLAMTWFNPVNSVLIASLAACGVGVMMAQRRAVAGAVVGLVAVVLGTNLGTSWLDVPRIDDAKGSDFRHLHVLLSEHPTMEVVDTHWGPFARTDVVRDTRQPGRLDFFTNGTVPTILLREDRRTGTRQIPSGLLIDFPFAWRRPESVLTIGPGAGLDILLAKKVGAQVVHGVEVNPAMPLLIERHQSFGGDPYGMPGVDVAIGDGRTFVARAERKYELVIFALTKAGTGSVGSSMVECYLYTQEAVADYLDVLENDGVLAFVTDNDAQGLRFVHTVLEVLQERGIPPAEALDHLTILAPRGGRGRTSPYKELLLVGRQAFDREQALAIRDTAQQFDYRLRFVPGVRENSPYSRLRSGPPLRDYIREVEQEMMEATAVEGHERPDDLTLRPVGDDAPYFSDLRSRTPPGILPLVGITAGLLAVFSTVVLLRTRSKTDPSRLPPAGGLGILGYFFLLGVGFMAVEIPMIQKLILLLGHPLRALTVALFAILLGAAAGSLLSQRIGRTQLERRIRIVCLSVAVLVATVLAVLQVATQAILALELTPRMIVCGLLCFVLGLGLGMPFPLGLRAVGRSHGALVPLVWGVNGLASVLGGLTTAAGAKAFGFQAVILCGALAYIVAAVLPPWLQRERS